MSRKEIFIVGGILAIILGLFVAIITGNHWTTRQFGGNEELHLPVNKKLVNVTWRNSSLWILVRPMKQQEVPEVYDLMQDSNLGIMEGNVHIIEHKGGGQ